MGKPWNAQASEGLEIFDLERIAIGVDRRVLVKSMGRRCDVYYLILGNWKLLLHDFIPSASAELSRARRGNAKAVATISSSNAIPYFYTTAPVLRMYKRKRTLQYSHATIHA